jgi:hypothetical protein
MTGYIKLNKFDIDKDKGEFQWYNRGRLYDNIESEGVGYKGNLFFDGKTRFAKEQWHISYDFVDKKDGSEKDLKGKWIGYLRTLICCITTTANSIGNINT